MQYVALTYYFGHIICILEGDNTIMELKIVQDIFRGRTSMLPWGLMLRVMMNAQGRRAVGVYLSKLARATMLGKKAIGDGQLLKDIAWARAHIRVIDVWMRTPGAKKAWLESYERVLMVFPMRLQC
jgi:hypothetical protein